MRVFVSFQNNSAGSKQASYGIMTMEVYAILDKAKHKIANTRHLILAAVTGPTYRWLHLFSNLSHFQVFEVPLLTSRMSANSDRPICAQLCCGLLCATCNRALRHFLLAVCKLLQ